MNIKLALRTLLSGLLIATLIVSLGSCFRKLKGENLLYEGTWTNGYLITPFSYSFYGDDEQPVTKQWVSGGETITIQANGRGSYSSFSSSGGVTSSKEIDWKAKIKKDKLTIKFSIIKEKFEITKSPSEDNYGWYMILDADTFRRID
jgi:hypothetical protein